MNSRKKFGFATAAAGLALMVAGIVAPTAASAVAVSTQTVALHNNTAQVGTDCPDATNDYWHFIISPNNGSYEFVSITLAFSDSTSASFSGAGIVLNGTQKDNVFVKVPAGKTLASLVKLGSSAEIAPPTGDPGFVLSHLCDGTPETTTTTAAPTTTVAETTTTVAETTTTVAETTTTVAETTTTVAETTTTVAETTTTVAETTTTLVDSEGPTTTVAETTTTVAEETTTTLVDSEGPTTTAQQDSGGPTTTLSSVPGLPRTGGSQTALIALGVLMVLGGILFIALTRRPDEA